VNTTIVGGLQVVWSGGIDSNTVINVGSQHVGPTGSAFSATVNSGGFQYNYGVASGTIVNSAGSAITFSGGTTTSAQINSGGTYHVIAGGIADDLAVIGTGQAFVWSGGSLQDATISGGFLQFISGALTSGSEITFATAGGTVKFDDSVSIDAQLSISGYGFQSGTLAFADIGFTSGVTSATWNQSSGSAGVLTITSGTLQASINLFGNYVAGDFTPASYGVTGTQITDTTAAPPGAFSLLANPHA
jgi:autotransporter passenger strand-loop-strand repeat protein